MEDIMVVNEVEEMDEETMVEEDSVNSSCGNTLVGVILGAGLVGTGIVLTKLVKKGIAWGKARKARRENEKIVSEVEHDVVDEAE